MIAFLEGKLAGKTQAAAYINVSGVGYRVAMSASALSKLPAVGEPLLVLTYLQVTDAGVFLYGFLTEEEKALFERLISVSGVGPKVALAALSTFAPAQLIEAIAAQDTARVAQIPGVGKKTASRIILELKGSLEQDMTSLFSQGEEPPANALSLRGATEALLSMGFTQAEAELALKGSPEGADETALLQYALKRLGSR